MIFCGEETRLLDIYIAALAAYHEAQKPIIAGLRPDDPDFQTAMKTKEAAQVRLLQARRNYWKHIELHRCRERRD